MRVLFAAAVSLFCILVHSSPVRKVFSHGVPTVISRRVHVKCYLSLLLKMQLQHLDK